MKREKKELLKIRGKRIREARVEKGLTQEELGKKCGYKDGVTIYKIEKGLQSLPVHRMNDLCRALGVTYDEICGDILIEFVDGHSVIVERHINETRKDFIIKQITGLLKIANEEQLEIIHTFVKGYIKEDNNYGDPNME